MQIADETGDNGGGAVGNSVAQVTGAILGDSNQGLNFPGFTDENGGLGYKCTYTSSPWAVTSAPFALELWVKTTQTDAVILAPQIANHGFRVDLAGGSLIAGFHAPSLVTIPSQAPINDGQWHRRLLESGI